MAAPNTDDRRVDTKVWSAALLTPSGQYVSVTEWNSAARDGAPISRAPLSSAQLTKVVTAEVWQQVVAPNVEDQEKWWTETPTPSQAEGPTVAALLGTLVPLLPNNLQVLDQGQDHPYLHAHDGKTTWPRSTAQFGSTSGTTCPTPPTSCTAPTPRPCATAPRSPLARVPATRT
ncbi:hypothetical protein SAMN04487981_12756 [Streptomyces sp. cf386]|uniref:hypothetical protein n=1 Tax=Streptomyces sp. cf386 TaxID=1761904 RepID=UPI00089124E1|nr:hypothetical protein [Streptomyces sp. cf386]SDP57699.1 hypothetical protein SAMN04487981_12756 [Streptomyces sp. cf386]